MRIGISGAKGRIGAALCQELSKVASYQLQRYSSQPGSDGEFYSTRSLTNPEVLREMDVLIHAAWSTVPIVAEQFPLRIWQTDLPLLGEILEALRLLPLKKRPFLIFPSSASVYGEGKNDCLENVSIPKPASWYAFGKLSAEHMIQEFAKRYDLKCMIIRLSNVYGCWNPSVPQGVISRLLAASFNGEEVEIWGDGSALKDYIHIDDVIFAIKRGIAQKLPGLFNLSYARSYSLSELISIVETVTGKKVKQKYRPAFDWDVSQSLIVNRQFVERFGWRPTITIEEGIARCAVELGHLFPAN